MTKSLLTGIAVCSALAFAGSAYASVKRPAHKHPIRTAETAEKEYGGRPGYPTQFRIPAHPLVWDCVHVTFPQCSPRGYDNLNDGSFK
jgi:hypothetical protein